MATGLMLKKLVLKNLLSFGPEGVELELGPLNVLIGPNASGKSNLIDAIRLLAACPKDVMEPIVKGGGFESWLYHGGSGFATINVEAQVEMRHTTPDEYDPFTDSPLRHSIELNKSYYGVPCVLGEQIVTNFQEEIEKTYDRDSAFQNEPSQDSRGRAERKSREIGIGESMIKYADNRELPISELASFYERVSVYADWNTSRSSSIRQPQPADADGSRLSAEGTNLVLVLNLLDNKPIVSRRIVSELTKFVPRAMAIKTPVVFGQVGGYLEEAELSENVPFSRLSDGTLRWLCLLTVLLHPDPPSLICLEEPEVGLHPDMIRRLAQLLVEASQRTQIVVTTHSDLLVSALSDHPESIVVCEHNGGSTKFFKVEAEYLSKYIQDYALGDAWLKGELGGTRY